MAKLWCVLVVCGFRPLCFYSYLFFTFLLLIAFFSCCRVLILLIRSSHLFFTSDVIFSPFPKTMARRSVRKRLNTSPYDPLWTSIKWTPSNVPSQPSQLLPIPRTNAGTNPSILPSIRNPLTRQHTQATEGLELHFHIYSCTPLKGVMTPSDPSDAKNKNDFTARSILNYFGATLQGYSHACRNACMA